MSTFPTIFSPLSRKLFHFHAQKIMLKISISLDYFDCFSLAFSHTVFHSNTVFPSCFLRSFVIAGTETTIVDFVGIKLLALVLLPISDKPPQTGPKSQHTKGESEQEGEREMELDNVTKTKHKHINTNAHSKKNTSVRKEPLAVTEA